MRLRPILVLLTLALFVWITQQPANTQSARALEVSRGLAQRHLDALVDKHGGPQLTGRRELRGHIDDDGRSHHAVQQLHRGVPVWGGEAIVHLDAAGELEDVTDDFKDDVAPVDVTPVVTASAAIDAAIVAAGVPPDSLTAEPVADLWIVREDSDRLAYRVRLRREDGSQDTALPVIFIDAFDGSLVSRYDNLQTAGTTVSGTSTYYGSLTLNGFLSGVTYYLEDVVRKVGTFDFRNGTSSMFRTNDSDGIYNASNQKAMVDAHYAATMTWDYYKNTFNRNGIDGTGGPVYLTSIDGVTGMISSLVHYSTNYNNAFWNGQYMTYGDGDGSTFTSLTTLDIGGHEMTHGVIERTAGLVYSGESGALNESFADVFGAMVERYASGESASTWKIGEMAYTPANGTADALRYMDNPHLAANSGFTSDDDPDHYSERYTGASDNGGVHINSGIGNKAFYLVAKGGTHHLGGSMTGIGADAAAAIWYKALTTYMTSQTNFAGARTATLNAAVSLYGNGSTQYNAVCEAWSMVGVGTSCTAPPPPPSGGAGLLENSGFETVITPWVVSGTGAYYVGNGNYPHAGTGYIYFGAANSMAGQIYQQVSIPSTAASANLTFWLNVTSDETTTTTQYDKLFAEVRNSAGTLLTTLATYSNLNKGTAGTYSQKSFSLLAYKGQTIRIQFRATTDSSLQTTFRIDDACLEGCGGTGGAGNTSTSVAASPASPTYGSAVTFTATVSGSGNCTDPAGTVTFTDGATTIGSASLNGSNQAAVSTSGLAVGVHTISAAFAASNSASCLNSSGTASTTIAKANQTVTFVNAPASRTYGDPAFAVSGNASSGLPVSFSIPSGPATIAGNTVTVTGAGTVTLRASQGGNTNYNPAPDLDRLITIAKASQTVAFNPPSIKTFGDPAFAVSGNATSGLPVTFSIASGPATIVGNTVTLTGAGTVTVRASQGGNSNYDPAPDVDRLIDVSKATQVITFAAPPNKTFGDPAFSVSGNASSGLPVTFSIASGPASIVGNTVTLTGAGTVTVRASQAGNSNYAAATDVDRSFTVAKSDQTVTFVNAPPNKTYGDPAFVVSGNASSGLPVKFSIPSGPATIAGNTVTLTGAGTVTLRASQAGNNNYNAAPDVDRLIEVAKKSQTVTFFNAPSNKTFGDPAFAVSGNASSGLPVTFSIPSGPATIIGNTVKLSGAGIVTVRASQVGNANYSAAPDVDKTITVAKGSQTITFAALPNKTTGDAPFAVDATASSNLPVTFSILSGDATILGNVITVGSPGTVVVRASQAGNANYEAASDVDRSFEVLSASQRITFEPIPGKTFGDVPFTVSATASSGLPVTFSIVSGPATIAGDLVSITGAGIVVVRASQAGNQDFGAAADVDQAFTVAKAGQSIAFGALASRTFGDAPFSIGATASSGLAVNFHLVSGPALIDGSTITITGAGAVTVRASQDGDSNYQAAADVEQTFSVAKADQSIDFAALGNKVFGDAPFAIGATATSGLDVTFAIAGGPASLGPNNVVTLTGAGQVVIRASQGGDANHNPAADVDQVFMVAQPTQSISFDTLADATYGVAPIALSASSSAGLPIDFTIVSGPATLAGSMLTVTGAGSVVVRASQPGDANYAPADPVDRSFTVAPAPLLVIANSAARGYFDNDPVFTGSINGLVNGDPIALVITSPTTGTSAAGVYDLQVSFSDPLNRLANYAVTTQAGSLTISNPAPVLSSVTPASVALSAVDREIVIDGLDFVPQAIVNWNDTPLQVTNVTPTQITAIVPAAQLAAIGVRFISVSQGGPGGGTTASTEFFITNTGAPVDDADTGTSGDGGTADASVGGNGPGTPDSVSVSAVGEGSVTVAQFEDNPGPPVTFQNTDRFFDVFVPQTSDFTSLTIVSCDLNGGNLVLWSDGVSWMPVSNQSFNAVTGCVTIVIDDTTSPSISQLTGTYFVAAVDVIAPTTTAAGATTGGAYAFGSWTNENVVVTLTAVDNAGGSGVASLTSSASGATTLPETTAPGAAKTMTISADGETTIAFYATDAFGNQEPAKTRIVRIDRGLPTATAQASTTSLWPPNGKPVAVTISGRIADATGVAGGTFAVGDEYGEISTTGNVTVAADGSYRFTVNLPASRRDDDKDGRKFAIKVDGIDRAGNHGTAEAIVIVPHSQGKK